MSLYQHSLLLLCLFLSGQYIQAQKDLSTKRLEINPRAHAILRGDQKKYHAFVHPGVPECKDPSQLEEDGPSLSSPTSLKIYRFDPSFDPSYAVHATVFEEKTSCYLNFFGVSTRKELWEVPADFNEAVDKEWKVDIQENAKELISSGVLGQVFISDKGIGKYRCCWMSTCYRTRYTIRMKLIRVNWGSQGHIVSPFYNKNCKVNRGPTVSNCSVTKSTNLFWKPLNTPPFSCRIKEITNAPGVIRGFRSKEGVTSISFTSADYRVMFGLQAGKVQDMNPECVNGKGELVFYTEAGVMYTFAPHQGHAIVGYWFNPDNPKEWTDLMMKKLKSGSGASRISNQREDSSRPKRSNNRELPKAGKGHFNKGNQKTNKSMYKNQLGSEEISNGNFTATEEPRPTETLKSYHEIPVDFSFLKEGHPVPPQLILKNPPSQVRSKRSAIDNLPLDVEIHALTERVSWTQAQLLYQLNLLANKTTQQLEYSLYQSCVNRRLLLHLAEALIPFDERPLVYHYLRHEGFLSSVKDGTIYINVGVPVAKIFLGEVPSFCNEKLIVSFESPNLGIRQGLMINRKGLILEENESLDGKTNCHEQLKPNHFYIPLIDGDVYDVVTSRTLSSPLMNTSVVGLTNWEVNSFPIYELKDMKFVNRIAEDGMRMFVPDLKGSISRDSIWSTLEEEMNLPFFLKSYWHWILSVILTFVAALVLMMICISCSTKIVRESFSLGFK